MNIIKLKLKTQNIHTLTSFVNIITWYLNESLCNVSVTHLPKLKNKIILFSSPHVNKKSKEQFQLITHKCLITISNGYYPGSSKNDVQITRSIIKTVHKLIIKIPSSISLKTIITTLK